MPGDLRELLDAARPFTLPDVPDRHLGGPDDYVEDVLVTVGDIRRLRAAIARIEEVTRLPEHTVLCATWDGEPCSCGD